MSTAQPSYTTAAQPNLSDFTYICVQPMSQPMAQSLPVEATQLAYNQQCPSYYYSVETADFYGADYQPNYVSTTASNNLIAATANQTILPQTAISNPVSVAYEPQIDIVSTATAAPTPHPNEFIKYKAAVTNEISTTPPTSSDYSSPGCSTSPSSTTSLSSATSATILPPEIHAKVFSPPSAINPGSHQRTPRRNKFELNAKRVHYCTEPGLLWLINFLQNSIKMHAQSQIKTLAISK